MTPTLRSLITKQRTQWIATAAIMAVVLALAWITLKPRPIAIEIAGITTGPMQVTIDGQGQVRLHDKYLIAAPVAAELARIELHEGDKVAAGQRLAVLRPLPLDARQKDEALARLDAAEALARAAQLQVQRAAADQQLATSELARVEKLVTQGFMSAQSVEHARNAMSVSNAELKSARAREAAALADVNSARAALPAGPGKADKRTLELT
ncbi:MAG: hypothetical protein JNM52_10580, partial [Betaproteobacteria bacterium]|nr:hypothetical protein [Betaproteobacteria bacterium]